MKKLHKGRRKGTPNKRTLILADELKRKKLDPIKGLLSSLQDLHDIKAVHVSDKISVAKAKANIFLDLLQYLYPKRKAVEIQRDSGIIPSMIQIKWADENDSPDAPADATSEADQSVN